MDDYLVSLFLGFSFGNLWLCALLVFSLQTTNRSTCGGYLLGRALTIVALAMAVSFIGHLIVIERGPLNLASGGFLLIFALYLAATQVFGWVPPWRRTPISEASTSNCDGNCNTCPTHGHPQYSSACADCNDATLCSAEEPEVEPLTRLARSIKGRATPEASTAGFLSGMALGSLRGAALCGKLTVLTPVLLAAPVGRAAGLGLTFSIASSIYPLMGFVLGAFALRLIKFKRWLFAASCTSLAGFGVFYLVRGVSHLMT